VSKDVEGAMGFELWKTLGISWPVGVGVLVAGLAAAAAIALLVSRRRALAQSAAGLRLGPRD
jgi:hypothetical protein